MSTADLQEQGSQGLVYTPRANRPALRRRVSPFTIILSLFGTAIAIVLYISNIIAVNQLLREIGDLETRERQILAEQEILRSQINRLSGLERIQNLVERGLSLKSPQIPPIWITVDSSRMTDLEQAAAIE